MKSTLSKLAVMSSIAIAMLFTSCGKKDTPESITDEMISQFGALSAAFDGVKDKESAEAAAKKIDTIGDDMVEIVKRGSALKDPSAEVQAELEKKVAEATSGYTEKMTVAMTSLAADPEAIGVLGEAMKKFGEKMAAAEQEVNK